MDVGGWVPTQHQQQLKGKATQQGSALISIEPHGAWPIRRQKTATNGRCCVYNFIHLYSVCVFVTSIQRRGRLLFVFVTRHTLVRQGTKFAVFFSLSGSDISSTVAPIPVRSAWNFARWYTSVPDRSSSLWGRSPGIPKIRNFGPKYWPLDREYLENGKSQRYMNLTSARQELFLNM